MPTFLIKYIAIAFVFLGLVAGLLYYKADAATKQATIEKQVAEIARINLDKQVLKAGAERVKKQMNLYIDQIASLAENNQKLNKDIQDARQKMANHKLVQLRNSRHSELVLKIINKSIDRIHDEWMEQ